jgi:hypothetical protein
MEGYSGIQKILLVLSSLLIEVVEIVVLYVVLSSALYGGWSSIDYFRLIIVYFSAMIPSLFMGAGSREAATLILFSGLGDDHTLFLAAFATTFALGILPSLPGMLLIWSNIKAIASDSPNTKKKE